MNLLPTMPNQNPESSIKAILPYWPVVAFCVTCLTGLGGIFVKLDYISKAVDKTEVQFAIVSTQIGTLSDRQNLNSQSIIELRGSNERQNADLMRHAADIEKLKGAVDLVKNTNKWTPR